MGMGTVGSRIVALARATSKLHRQAVSVKLGPIFCFSFFGSDQLSCERRRGREHTVNWLGRVSFDEPGSRGKSLTRNYITRIHRIFIFNKAEPVNQLDILDLASGILEMLPDVFFGGCNP